MKEQTLKDFLTGNETIDFLLSDLKNSQRKTGLDTTEIYIDQIKNSGGFEITIDHLILLCDSVINGKLTMTDINTIAFALIASEYFTWDSESKNGERIENVLFDWDNPEIGYDLNYSNFKLWRDYILTGNYKFDKNELKPKFK